MIAKQCSVDECDKPVTARGWCSLHYHRWRRHGDPLWTRSKLSFEEKLAYYVAVGDCWLWTGADKGNGYGNVYWEGKLYCAHRWVWLNLVGPIEDGLDLDHLCRVRSCVNPDHLEPVTRKVNCERGEAARKRYCKNGHDLWEPGSVRISKEGYRVCKPCRADMERARQARLKGKKPS